MNRTRFRRRLHVNDPLTIRRTPFVVMCIPGRREDGSDSSWFVLDRRTMESTPIGDGDDKLPVAISSAHHANLGVRSKS